MIVNKKFSVFKKDRMYDQPDQMSTEKANKKLNEIMSKIDPNDISIKYHARDKSNIADLHSYAEIYYQDKLSYKIKDSKNLVRQKHLGFSAWSYIDPPIIASKLVAYLFGGGSRFMQ